METIYDWITVAVFAALVTRFLAQSVRPEGPLDFVGHYLIASTACAIANWLGNNEYHAAATAVIIGALTYIFLFVWKESGRPSGD